MSKNFDATVKQAFTMNDAKNVVNEETTMPQVITFQLTTNDVKNQEPLSVLAKYKDLISTVKRKMPQSKVIISNAPIKDTITRNSVRTAVVNASLRNDYLEEDIVCIDNMNVTSFAPDGIHLTRSVSTALVRNIRNAINKSLDIIPIATVSHNKNYSNWKNSNSGQYHPKTNFKQQHVHHQGQNSHHNFNSFHHLPWHSGRYGGNRGRF